MKISFFVDYKNLKIYEMSGFLAGKDKEPFETFEDAKERLIEFWFEKQKISFENLQKSKQLTEYISMKPNKIVLNKEESC